MLDQRRIAREQAVHLGEDDGEAHQEECQQRHGEDKQREFVNGVFHVEDLLSADDGNDLEADEDDDDHFGDGVIQDQVLEDPRRFLHARDAGRDVDGAGVGRHAALVGDEVDERDRRRDGGQADGAHGSEAHRAHGGGRRRGIERSDHRGDDAADGEDDEDGRHAAHGVEDGRELLAHVQLGEQARRAEREEQQRAEVIEAADAALDELPDAGGRVRQRLPALDDREEGDQQGDVVDQRNGLGRALGGSENALHPRAGRAHREQQGDGNAEEDDQRRPVLAQGFADGHDLVLGNGLDAFLFGEDEDDEKTHGQDDRAQSHEADVQLAGGKLLGHGFKAEEEKHDRRGREDVAQSAVAAHDRRSALAAPAAFDHPGDGHGADGSGAGRSHAVDHAEQGAADGRNVARTAGQAAEEGVEDVHEAVDDARLLHHVGHEGKRHARVNDFLLAGVKGHILHRNPEILAVEARADEQQDDHAPHHRLAHLALQHDVAEETRRNEAEQRDDANSNVAHKTDSLLLIQKNRKTVKRRFCMILHINTNTKLKRKANSFF